MREREKKERVKMYIINPPSCLHDPKTFCFSVMGVPVISVMLSDNQEYHTKGKIL